METLQYIERKIHRVDIQSINQEEANFAPVYAKFNSEKYKGVGTARVLLHSNLGSEIVDCALVKTIENERFFVMSNAKHFAYEVTKQIKIQPSQKMKPLPSLSGIGMAMKQLNESDLELVEDINPAHIGPSMRILCPTPDFLARHGK